MPCMTLKPRHSTHCTDRRWHVYKHTRASTEKYIYLSIYLSIYMWRENLTYPLQCVACAVLIQRVKSAYVGKFIKAKRKHAETVREVRKDPKS
jgi:hypothetical protein